MTLRLDAVDLSAFEPASEAGWRAAVAKVLKGQPFETLRTMTADGTIEPLYARATGAQPIAPARGNAPWGITARVDHPDAAAANGQALSDLEGGATGLDLVFAASPHAHGFGLSDDADLPRILEGVMADLVAIRISGGQTTIARALDVVAASGVAADRLKITLAHDPIAESVRAGGSDVPLADLVTRMAVEAVAFATQFGGQSLLVVDGRIWHEAGASRTETLAVQLATAVTYWRALTAAGLSVEDAAVRIGFVSAIDQGQFSSIAELRALRLLWARATEAAGLGPQRAVIHAESSFRMLSRRDANTNMIRNTVAAFAAGVGGVDSLTILPHSEANGLPDALSRRIARNTHLILQEESNLHRVVDPGQVPAASRPRRGPWPRPRGACSSRSRRLAASSPRSRLEPCRLVSLRRRQRRRQRCLIAKCRSPARASIRSQASPRPRSSTSCPSLRPSERLRCRLWRSPDIACRNPSSSRAREPRPRIDARSD